jgi:protein-disulfide isomerase
MQLTGESGIDIAASQVCSRDDNSLVERSGSGETRRMRLVTLFLAAVGLAFGVAPLARAHGDPAPAVASEIGDAEAAKIEAVLRKILADHPEIVAKALEDAERARLAKTESGKAALLARLLPEIESDAGAFAAGPKGEPAANVVFLFDYHCAPCKRATVELMAHIETYPDVRFVFKEMPVLRPQSRLAAKAALAARDQDKYLDFHAAMMSAPGLLGEERIVEIARDSGLDVEALKAAMRQPAIDEEIDATLRVTKNLNIEGTPGFFVNGEFLPGRDDKRLVAAIEQARAARKGTQSVRAASD